MILQKLIAYARLMRLDKPIGVYLLLWPTLWGLWLSARGIPEQKLLLIFIAGVFIMRAAGCVVNDIYDRRIDVHVARTRHRPLAQNSISVTEAVIILVLLLSLAFWLVLQLNQLCLLIAGMGLGLTLIYPLLKRFTYFPQVLLGIIFGGISPLMAFAAQQGKLTLLAWTLFGIASLWPIAYDTIYALADKIDDQKIGVKSLAIYLGRHAESFITVVQLILFTGLLLIGIYLKLNLWFYLGLFGGFCFLLGQLYLLTKKDPQQYIRAFRLNNWQGMAIFLGLFMAFLN
jgi:4-hydroxybenzoate polyprenyltransferase